MANIKSQMKRIKTNEKARQRNKAVKSALRTHVRRFREAADAGDAEKAQTLAQTAYALESLVLSVIDCRSRARQAPAPSRR